MKDSKDITDTPLNISNYRERDADCYTLSSHKVMIRYGVSRSIAINMQHKHWSIDTEYREIFSSYYLLKWMAEYFHKKMRHGTVKREGVTYQVVYHKCNGAAIYNNPGQVYLSFRELQEDYKAGAVVLVTVA